MKIAKGDVMNIAFFVFYQALDVPSSATVFMSF
jgi:hypothetical protein